MQILSLSSAVLILLRGYVVDASVLKREDSTAAPCAIVSASAASQLAVSPSVAPTIDAQTAYDCLASVPINQTAAAALIQSMSPYLEWQSDISYLKNPPKGYQMPAIDVWSEFSTIETNVKNGKYENEWAFQADILKTVQAVHDGHFRFVPDLIGKTVQFRRPVSVVSVSRDGVEIPMVYVKEDIIAYNAANHSIMPSPIMLVNGQNVTAFLMELANLGFLQDPDALYNNLFFEMAFDSQSQDARYSGFFALAGRYGYFYPGPDTTIQFDNGTTNKYQNYAQILGDFTGVTDGPSAYQKFCTGPHLQPVVDDSNAPVPSPATSPLPSTTLTPAYGYPTPIVISPDNQVSSYFLDDPAHPDVAVLSMVSFEPSSPVEFQSVIQTTIEMAKAAGKSKIIIDLSSNGGGIILTGYDAFRQFFPTIIQDGFSRFRKHEAFDIMTREISKYSANFSETSIDPESFFAWTSPLNYRFDLNESDGNFPSYDSKFGGEVFNGDDFTDLMRWNLSDPAITTNAMYGLGESITGYGNRTNFTQPFAAEDMILLYDGYCGSTCVIFSEFMRVQGGVKSVAMGGRPNTNQIQAIGGTKGANNYQFAYIQTLAGIALSEVVGNENLTAALQYSDLPLNRSVDTSLNVRDNILRANLIDGTPAQFLYEAADCRLFYEPSMITDVKSLWNRVADAAWGGRTCVAGSLPKRTETVAERERRSNEMMIRARTENKESFQVLAGDAVYKPNGSTGKRTVRKSAEHGQKVSWSY